MPRLSDNALAYLWIDVGVLVEGRPAAFQSLEVLFPYHALLSMHGFWWSYFGYRLSEAGNYEL
jgi:hypothetical protein